jgi:hydrogenase maturation protein HypF
MEALVDPDETGYYPVILENGLINPKPLFEAIIVDLHENTPIQTISARFHNSIVQFSLEVCKLIRSENNINTVALSGGVWQNKVLLENTIKRLNNDRFDVMIHQAIPTNDGGISLGQAIIASKYIKNS